MTDGLRRVPLDQAVAAALLAVPSSHDGVTLAARLEAARQELAAVVLEVRAHLESSPLAPAIARDTAHQEDARLIVGADGMLFSQTVEQSQRPPALPPRVEEPEPVPSPPPPVVVPPRSNGHNKRIWTTTLPSLEELRVEARTLGLNVEAFGRKKVELAEAIRATKAGEPVTIPPPEPTTGKLAKAAAAAEDLDIDGILRPVKSHRPHA